MNSQVGTVQDLLLQLNSLNSPGSAQVILQDIKDICLRQPLSEREIVFANSLLFSDESGLLTFISRTTGNDQYVNGKLEALNLLGEVFDKFPNCSKEYALKTKNVCFAVFLRDKSSKTRKPAMLVVSKVLEMCAGTSCVEDLNIGDMIEKMFYQLAQGSKLTPTVKQEVLCVLGLFGQHYFEQVMKYNKRILNLYLSELRQQITSKTKNPDPSVVAGCLQGLTGYLYNFTVSSEEDPENSYKIYDYSRKVIEASKNLSRYEMLRSALSLLAKHAPQFSTFLFEDYERLYCQTTFWCRHQNREVSAIAFSAMESILKQISETLNERLEHGNKDNMEQDTKVFMYFIQEFQETMSSGSDRHIAVAVRGYGYYAAACKFFPDEPHLLEHMLAEILQRSESLCSSLTVALEEKVKLLPSFLESLSSILKEIKNISPLYLASVENLVIFLFEHFPQLVPAFHFFCYRALLLLFLSLSSVGATQQGFLSRVVYHGLLRTCSHAVVSEVKARKEEGITKDKRGYYQPYSEVTYINYVPLWKNLLDVTKSQELRGFGFNLAEKEALRNSLYNEIMSSVLLVISKLEFGTESKAPYHVAPEDQQSNQIVTSDPFLNLQAINSNDFQLFLNVVEFCQDILLSSNVKLFENWVYKFGLEAVRNATKYPYVSGFYKLVALCLNICNKTKYFGNVQESKEKLTSFNMFSKFSKDVLIRFQQYKDDLLASCLLVVLALPPVMVIEDVCIFIPALKRAFNLGFSYLPLAVVALKTLDRWCKFIPLNVLQPLFSEILPLLTKYLQASSQDKPLTMSDMVVLRKPSSTGKGPKKISLKLVKAPSRSNTYKVDDSQLTNVRLQVLHFLGSLGGVYNKSALNLSAAEVKKEAIAWDIHYKSHLTFTLPFSDLKVDITFDEFLPVILSLATSVSDRQTRVAACELLHASVILMVGKIFQSAASNERVPMDKLLKHVFPALLTLACDVEQVAKDLFKLQVEQLIHWFTNKYIIHSPETFEILECIWDGVTEENNTALRDFSAQMLREFVSWAIKQTTPKELEKSPYNIGIVLKKLYSYSLHPCIFKRLGAALAFNNMYTLIREEDSLVSIFSLEIAVNLVNSLAIAHHDDKSFGSQIQCKKAISHMERILKVRCSLFQKTDHKRKVPQCLEDGTLKAFVLWLLSQCNILQTECRHTCMELVFKLSPSLDGFTSAKDFIQHLSKTKGTVYFQNIISGKLRPNSEFLKGDFHARCDWLDALLASLDCFTWILGQQLLSANQLLKDSESHTSKDKFLISMEFFICNVAFKSLQDLCNNLEGDLYSEYSEHQSMTYNKLKCTVLIRFLNFLTVFTSGNSNPQALLSDLWIEEFWRLLVTVILNPLALGFEMTDLEVTTNLPQEISSLLVALKKGIPDIYMKEFRHILNKEIHAHHELNLSTFLPIELNEICINSSTLPLQCLLRGYCLLSVHSLWPDLYDKKTVSEKLLACVWDTCFKNIDADHTGLTPSAIKLGKELLNLSFTLDCEIPNFVSQLLNAFSESRRGFMLFTKLFREEIFMFLIENCQAFVSQLFENLSVKTPAVFSMLIDALDFVGSRRDIQRKYGSSCLESVLTYWSQVHSFLKTCTEDNKNQILLLLSKFILTDPQVLYRNTSSVLLETFLCLLKSKQNILGYKARVLELLPFFLGDNKYKDKIREALENLATDHFPLNSHEYPKGSSKRNDLLAVYKKLLEAMILTGEGILLEFLSLNVSREASHLIDREFEQALQKTMKRLGSSEQHCSAQLLFQMWWSSNEAEQGSLIVQKALLPVLHMLSASNLKLFYSKNICSLMDIIKEKLSKYSDDVLRTQLIRKTASFKIIKILFGKLEKESITGKESPINSAYCGGRPESGKELVKDITSLSHQSKKEDCRGENTCGDIRRVYHCSAYNTIMSVISRTQSEDKFFNAFLFQENTLKGDFLWDNIIDCTRTYCFDFELEDPLEKKQQFVSIRQTHSNLENSSAINYMASQYLSGSSLSADVSQFDFSSSEQVPSSSSGEEVPNERKATENRMVSTETVQLEQDDLNSHECMGDLVALVKHLVTVINNPGDDPPVPKFLELICRRLQSHDTHLNIKLFLGRLIYNCSETMKPYAKYLVDPLLNVIIGSSIDYFVIDTLSLCLSWSAELDIKVEPGTASGILFFLVKKSNHPRRDVFRSILEVVKTVVECWKPIFTIPYSAIFDQMELVSDPNSRSFAVGAQLLGVILANDLPPFDDMSMVEKNRCFKYLSNGLRNKYKEVYAPTAEVVGMLFRYFENHRQQEEEFEGEISKIVSVFMEDQKAHFITCVCNICRHYSAFAEKFLDRFLFILPTVHGSFTGQVLEVILAGLGKSEEQFQLLKGKGLLDLIQHRDESRQLYSCKILQKLSSQLTANDWLQIVPILSKINAFQLPDCRKVVYEIMMTLYEQYSSSDEFKAVEILKTSKQTLILGLMDHEKALSIFCSNFWSRETHLSSETSDRLLGILSDLYSPATEEQFLQYSSYLVLEMTSRSPDFKRKIFDKPLSACKFQDYKIQASWHQQHASMTPLFAETLSLDSADPSTLDSTDGDEPNLRATQKTLQFSATQAGGSFDWVSQSSLEMDFSGSLSESSLLFSVGSSPKKDFDRGRLSSKPSKEPSAVESKTASDLRKLKMRFLKDRDKVRVNIIKRNYRRNQQREEMMNERAKLREAKVTIYRQYRSGELPDIEISYDAVIIPLQVLAQCNLNMAKLLMKSLIISVGNTLKDRSHDQFQIFCQKTLSSLHNIVSNSEIFCPPVISFALEVLHEYVSENSLQPDDIHSTAIASIFLLESSLLSLDESGNQSTKRARLSRKVQAPTTVCWIQLAKLYKSINSLDMVRGIFSAAVELQGETRNALELEAQGDFAGALKIYENLYEAAQSKDDEEIEQAEVDLCDDSIIECYSQLTRWNKLQDVILARIPKPNDLLVLWEDTFYQEHYLPKLFNAKLKLILEGQQEQSLLDFLDASMANPERKSFIETRLSFELALLYIVQDNFDRASYYCDITLRRFIEDWTNLSILTPGVREEKFQNLEKVTEMKDFLNIISEKNNSTSRTRAAQAIHLWKNRMPSFSDNILVWDDVILNRELYIRKFLHHLPSEDISDSMDSESFSQDDSKPLLHGFDEAVVQMRLSFADCACQKNNIPVALKHVKWIHKKVKESSMAHLWVDCIHAYCGVHQQRARAISHCQEKLKILSDVWAQLDKLEETHFTDSMLLESRSKHLLLKAHVLESISEALAVGDRKSLKEINRSQLESLQALIRCPLHDPNAALLFSEKCFTFLREAVALTEKNADQTVSFIANANVQLAWFCNKQLQAMDDAVSLHADEKADVFAHSLVASLLLAMKNGNLNAIQLFPRLLQVLESHPNCTRSFIEKSQAVPCWMFLSCINQILILLDRNIAAVAQPIITRIADTYPMALVYPFKLSKGCFAISTMTQEQKDFVQKIQILLNELPLVEDFVDALCGLQVPHVVFKNAFRNIQRDARDAKTLAEEIKNIHEQLLSEEATSRGKHHAEFKEAFSKDITSLLKRETVSSKSFIPEGNKLMEKMKKKALSQGTAKLLTLSKWLSSFQSFSSSAQLEIPGQYSGKHKPIPENHVMISSFDQNVTILQSIAFPRKLTIRGNDEKEYIFLVKAGEDLRQDNRIEHIFETMNSILKQDANCSAQKLGLTTYQVVPITIRLGLIEWVQNTNVLKSFIQIGLSNEEKKNCFGVRSKPNIQNEAFLNKLGRSAVESYGATYTLKDEEIKNHYLQLVSNVPCDMMRRTFLRLSSRPEAFVTLRTGFIESYATLCVAQWLLGIGDRHLSNFLVSMDTGKVLGIDFGHAFGLATQFLPIPELIPFRLTPCFLNLCLPVKEKGLLESTMIHCLTAFSTKHELLLNLMDIFIKEPTIDWQEFSKRQERAGMQTKDAKEDQNWYPKQRVQLAAKKLKGANPCHITSEELKLGHSRTAAYKDMRRVCLGNSKVNIRARMPDDSLTPEQQVSCLIDQATDPAILGRTFYGWEPWV